MIEGLHLLIFTPTYDGLLRRETVASIVAQQTTHTVMWEIGRCNPYPGRDMRNVLTQYNYGRELCLNGPYDALLTVEHDMVIPPRAVQSLCDTPAPVVYGTYLLRHEDPRINAWQYIGPQGLGMSLDRYPAELSSYEQTGVGRVSGIGFGCTLIRRQVLEQIPFRADGSHHAPDMPFALDCVRLGITQLARFDVKCGHVHEGVTLEIDEHGPTVKVKVLQPVNVLIDGSGVSLVEGEEVELPAKEAKMLADLGYVERAEIEAPAVPRRSKKSSEAAE